MTVAGWRLASIDLGTNTVRLLVVEAERAGAWRVLDQDQTVTRLGEGLASRGCLGGEPMARTRAVVSAYLARARRAGAGDVRIVATSAVREAANGPDFCAALEAIGAAVQVVSGEDEARLTLLGIVRGLGWPGGPLLAFDIGGGSTEFVLAADGRVVASASLRLGVVGLAEQYQFPRAVDWPRYRELEQLVRGRLVAELPPAIRRAGARELVGTAGTVTALAALDLDLTRYDAGRVHGHRLPRAVVERLRDRLGALTVEERAALPCLEPGRADLIVPGVAITLTALDVIGADAVVVSDWGLREGILAEALEGHR
ncbi:MAG TPA: Ppx/GppA phosphatase family protein [Methylomirabilota bacterium]|nr:Ppx/GppA phosphatase family protein [Methylomirabilota bacterium]